MRTFKNLILFFFILIAVSSCKEDPNVAAEQEELTEKTEAFENLKEEAIVVHDEIMPKMGQLMELSEQMQNKITADSTNQEYAQAKMKLNEAHDGMMEWMRDYSEKFPYGSESPATLEAFKEQMPILKSEVKEIKALKADTDQAISTSKALLQEDKAAY